MLQLWKAMIHLARHPALISECQAVAAEEDVPNPVPAKVKQPTKDAIIALDGILNSPAHNLRLSMYELAEVNRYCLQPGFAQTVADYAAGIDLGGFDTTGFNEAAGVLLFDRDFRQQVAGAEDPTVTLVSKGFAVTQAEADYLQEKVATGSPAAAAGEQFFTLLWAGSSCLQRLANYTKYSHPNY
jgi:hypothetical protein